MWSDMPFCFSLKIMLSRYTLANTLKIAMHLMICCMFFIQRRTKRYDFYHLLHKHILRSHNVVLIFSNLILTPDSNLNPVEFGWNSVDSLWCPINISLYCTVTCGHRKNCTGAQCAEFCKWRRMLYLSLPIDSAGHDIRYANIKVFCEPKHLQLLRNMCMWLEI